MFWKRKKSGDEEQLDADSEANADVPDGSQPKEEEEPQEERTSNRSALSADIERMKAHIDSLKEMRQANSERFSRISEQIGELRTMIVEQEKRMKDLDFKATKAADLVEEVHPESLMIELKKEDSKIEVLKAKMEGIEAISNNLVAELKNIRRDTTVFRGTESILKLNDEIMHNLTSIQKVQAGIERHSDKVEGIFVEMQKKTAEFQQMKDGLDSAGKSIRTLSKELDGTKLQFSNFATKEDYKSMETRVGSKLNEVDKQTESLQEKGSAVFQTVDKVVAEKMGEVDVKISSKFLAGDTLDERMKELENFSDVLKKQIESAPSLHFDNAIILLNEKMAELEKQKEELEEILVNDKVILSNIRDAELKMSGEISTNSMAIDKIMSMLGMNVAEELAAPTAPIAKENKGIFPLIQAFSKKKYASPSFPPQVAPESKPVPAFNAGQTATAANAVREREMHAATMAQVPPEEKRRGAAAPKKHRAAAGSAPQQAKIAATDLKQLMTPEMKQQFIKDIKSRILSNRYRKAPKSAGTWN